MNNARFHHIATSLTLSLAGIGSLLAATDPSVLQLPAHTWSWITLGITVAGVVVQAIHNGVDSAP